MMVHSYNQFHAAGHGLFFSGQLTFEKMSKDNFLWCYDCGSKRVGRMTELIKDLHTHSDTNEIDMLCISHFDADHVNGLLELLKVFSVKRLFLPYLPLNKRLEIACELDLDIAGSTDAMLFTLDPAGFLASRDTVGRVDSIVLVRGGGTEGEEDVGADGGNSPPRDILELPRRSDASEEAGQGKESSPANHTGNDYSPLLAVEGRALVMSISHATAFTWYRNSWEFVFYNNEPPNGVAPQSGVSLAHVQSEIATILDKWNMNSGSSQQIEGWRKDLRSCYDFHFGKSSRARNNISLCVLSRPLLRKEVDRCSIYKTPYSKLNCAYTLIPVHKNGKSGLLLTGDIGIDNHVLGNLKRHFGSVRWQDIHVMQIPHHGSRHSWKAGSAASCEHDYSVLCVPDIDFSSSHPHINVLDDLEEKRPLFANYSTSVVYCFHSGGLNTGWS